MPTLREPATHDQHLGSGAIGIEPQNIATASRLIREAVEGGAIVPYDADAAPKLMRYVPGWADPRRDMDT
jgi:hypothetical protein